MTCESCLEMLEVLTNEFGDMIPLETDPQILEANCPGALVKLRENSLIQVLPQTHHITNPLFWQFTLTQKGT